MNARFVGTTRFVSVDGPYANADEEWEWPEWTVLVTDDDGNEHSKVYICRTLEAAISLGEKMARDRRLELVVDASRA